MTQPTDEPTEGVTIKDRYVSVMARVLMPGQQDPNGQALEFASRQVTALEQAGLLPTDDEWRWGSDAADFDEALAAIYWRREDALAAGDEDEYLLHRVVSPWHSDQGI